MPSTIDKLIGIQAMVSSRCVVETLEIARLSYFWKLVTVNRVSPNNPDYLNFHFFPSIIQVSLKSKL